LLIDTIPQCRTPTSIAVLGPSVNARKFTPAGDRSGYAADAIEVEDECGGPSTDLFKTVQHHHNHDGPLGPPLPNEPSHWTTARSARTTAR
jgi:hypothetical protein